VIAVRIRVATTADYGAALGVIGDAFGFVVREPSVHTTVAGAPNGHLLVAERDGVIVGTGASVGFGPTGWIGGIAVAPEARGAGLGRALTEAAVEALGPRETLLLLASAAGRPIYERLGFEGESSYRSFWTPPDAAPVPGDTRALTLEDRDAVLELDARVTGEQRTLAVDVGLVGGLAAPDLAAVALRPPWPARPILARDPAAGAALLAAVLEPGVRLAVPDSNAPALEALFAHGCAEGPAVLRMRRGAPVAWRPDELWGVFSLFFG
jgi:GNAT superfamily N-acetyltransferase